MDDTLLLRLNPRIVQDTPHCVAAEIEGLRDGELGAAAEAFGGAAQAGRTILSAPPVRWNAACRSAGAVGEALQETLRRYRTREHFVRDPGGGLEAGKQTRIMGILNVTPDSFYDGGAIGSVEEAVEKGVRMAEQGAAIIDVGGESTRPGADPVPVDVEMDRVLPVVRGLANRGVAVSIDTSKAAVARSALKAGARWVNDVTALGDPEMASVVAEAGAALVLMHAKGSPKTMQQNPTYDDIIGELTRFLRERSLRAVRQGVSRDSILIDPGIGFGKRVEDNFEILRRLEEFRSLGFPLLVGPSRKSFIGAALHGRPASGRLFGTLSAVTVCALHGADFVRVHDVSEAVDACRVADRIKGKSA